MKTTTTYYSRLIDCTVQRDTEVIPLTKSVRITSKLRTKAQQESERVFNVIAVKIDRSNEQRNARRLKR